MKLLFVIASVFAIAIDAELAAKAMPNEKAIQIEARKFGEKLVALKNKIKAFPAEQKKIREAYFKKYAAKAREWGKQHTAIKSKFKDLLVTIKNTLKNSTVPKKIKEIRAMDKKLMMTVKSDVQNFLYEGMRLSQAAYAQVITTLGDPSGPLQ